MTELAEESHHRTIPLKSVGSCPRDMDKLRLEQSKEA